MSQEEKMTQIINEMSQEEQKEKTTQIIQKMKEQMMKKQIYEIDNEDEQEEQEENLYEMYGLDEPYSYDYEHVKEYDIVVESVDDINKLNLERLYERLKEFIDYMDERYRNGDTDELDYYVYDVDYILDVKFFNLTTKEISRQEFKRIKFVPYKFFMNDFESNEKYKYYNNGWIVKSVVVEYKTYND